MTNYVIEFFKLIILPKNAFKVGLTIMLFSGLGLSNILSTINAALANIDLPRYSVNILVFTLCFSVSSILIDCLIWTCGKTLLIINSSWNFLRLKAIVLKNYLSNQRATDDNYREIIIDLSNNELDYLDLFNSEKLKLSEIEKNPMHSDIYMAHYSLVKNKIISTKRRSGSSIEVHTINPHAFKILTKFVFKCKKPCPSIEIPLDHVLAPINSGGGALGSSKVN
ncbi:hypothetical protein [Methylotenera sp. L2L1]|uniref:hypothetical protein n=1 Tax=Methylotenera sp. L2L1 TaxID=1502770 RepID=UPI0005691E0F|nr:hypothetical protein [Methylotenera sp. L2L1]